MSRVYSVVFDQVSAASAQDLICIYSAATAKFVRLLRVVIGATDVTIPTSQMMAVKIVLLSGTVTAGSAGTSATPQKADPGDVAATVTARVNDTTGASGTTTSTPYESSFHAYNGLDESFTADAANPAAGKIEMVGTAAAGSAGSTAICVKLENAGTGTIHLNGTAWFEEAG
jgi:hypothetical protein